MVEAKRLKSGKISISICADLRTSLYWKLADFIGSETTKARYSKLDNGADVFEQLHLSVITSLVVRHHSNFFFAQQKFSFTRSEAISLIWFLRTDESLEMIAIKSALHKHLLG